jgi:hypothetical protein
MPARLVKFVGFVLKISLIAVDKTPLFLLLFVVFVSVGNQGAKRFNRKRDVSVTSRFFANIRRAF